MKGNIALLMPAVAKEMAGKGKGEDDEEAEGEGEGETSSSEPTEDMTAAAGALADAFGIKLNDAQKRAAAKALRLFLYCCEEE